MVFIVCPCVSLGVSLLRSFSSIGLSLNHPSHTIFPPNYLPYGITSKFFRKKRERRNKFFKPQREKARGEAAARVTVQAKFIEGCW